MSRAPLMRKVRPREVKWLAQGHTVMARLWPQTGCLQGLWALHCHASFSVGVICLMLVSLFLCWSTFNLRQLVHRFWVENCLEAWENLAHTPQKLCKPSRKMFISFWACKLLGARETGWLHPFILEINSNPDAQVSKWNIRQLPCLFLNLVAGEQSKERLPSFHPPIHSHSHKSYSPFELTELLLIASYWPVTRWSMGRRQSLPIHIFSGQQGSL